MNQTRTDDELFKEYGALYKNTPSIHKFKDLGTEEYRAFLTKKGYPFHVVNSQKYLLQLPKDVNLMGSDGFFSQNKNFFLAPVDLPDGSIIGYLLRGYKLKQYRYFKRQGVPSTYFGFYAFKDFKKNQPIILTEGSKDTLFLQQYYPYCLSLMGSGLSKISLTILRNFSTKFILAYDNDETGEESRERDSKLLRKFKCQYRYLIPPLKDFGKGFTHKIEVKKDLEECLNFLSTNINMRL